MSVRCKRDPAIISTFFASGFAIAGAIACFFSGEVQSATVAAIFWNAGILFITMSLLAACASLVCWQVVLAAEHIAETGGNLDASRKVA